MNVRKNGIYKKFNLSSLLACRILLNSTGQFYFPDIPITVLHLFILKFWPATLTSPKPHSSPPSLRSLSPDSAVTQSTPK